jgi:phosphate:Na+ symporter
MIFLNMMGAVALILFGIRALRKGLDRLFGSRLITWLQRTTESPAKAFGSGIIFGALTNSSSAISLFTMQMVDEGNLPAQRMLAVLLGANIGLTFSVQLLALNVAELVPLLLVLGVFGFQFCRRPLFRGIGQSLFGLGLIFLSIGMIGQAAHQIPNKGDLVQLLKMAESHPWIIVILITILTFFLQTSTASIGFGLGLASAGILSTSIMIPWVVGANLGIGCTALAAGWRHLEARRLAVANFLLKGVVALLALLFLPLTSDLIQRLPLSFTQTAAQFHSLYNLMVAGIGLAFLGPIIKFVHGLIQDGSVESVSTLSEDHSYLIVDALDTPSLALANATRETLVMADNVKRMLQTYWTALSAHDATLARLVQEHDDRVDIAYHELTKYLGQVGQADLSAHERWWQFTLLTFVNELEAAGDLLQKQLCELIIRQEKDHSYFTDMDMQRLEQLHKRVVERFNLATTLLTTQTPGLARQLVAGKEPFNEWCRTQQSEHYRELKYAHKESLTASAYFLEMLDALRRINSHISSLGYAFLPTAHKQARRSNEVVSAEGEKTTAPAKPKNGIKQ